MLCIYSYQPIHVYPMRMTCGRACMPLYPLVAFAIGKKLVALFENLATGLTMCINW